MQRIVIRHLSGSKAHQTELIKQNDQTEITFGRGRMCTVRYDATRDAVVGRLHARLILDSPDGLILVDLHSRNGTFVNNQRVFGFVKVKPGDVIRLGPKGPKFAVGIEPNKRLKFPSAPKQPDLIVSPEPPQSATSPGKPLAQTLKLKSGTLRNASLSTIKL